MTHTTRLHILVAIGRPGEARCECGYRGSDDELALHLAEAEPLRRMPDGAPCWCFGDMEPHDGWIHSEWCSSIRRLARRTE